MKRVRTFRYAHLRNSMLNGGVKRTKSANYREERQTPKQKYLIKYNNNGINNINDNNIGSIDLDFDIKNENELADKIYKANQLKIKENEIEDEEINSLNNEIRKLMIKNYEIQKNIQNQLNLRYIYEKNQKSIASYINNLNYKYRNYDNTINQYESKINKLKKDNQQLQQEYDLKIEEIDKENDKLRKRIKDRIDLYMHQKGEIQEKTAKTQNLENEIQIQNKLIKERMDMNKSKVDKLEDEYDELYKKIINLKVNCEDKTIKDMIDDNLLNVEEKGKNIIGKENEKKEENIEIKNKIESYKSNNNSLFLEIKELNKKYKELLKKDNSKDKKQRYSFHSTNFKTTSNSVKKTISFK